MHMSGRYFLLARHMGYKNNGNNRKKIMLVQGV